MPSLRDSDSLSLLSSTHVLGSIISPSGLRYCDPRISAKISGEKVLIFSPCLRASVVAFGSWLWLRYAAVCFCFRSSFVFLCALCGRRVLLVASISVYQRKSAVKIFLLLTPHHPPRLNPALRSFASSAVCFCLLSSSVFLCVLCGRRVLLVASISVYQRKSAAEKVLVLIFSVSPCLRGGFWFLLQPSK